MIMDRPAFPQRLSGNSAQSISVLRARRRDDRVPVPVPPTCLTSRAGSIRSSELLCFPSTSSILGRERRLVPVERIAV